MQNCKIYRQDTKLSKTNQMELLLISFAKSALKSRFRVILVVNIDVRVENACFKGKSCNKSKVSFLVQNCKICRRDTELSKTNQMELLLMTFAKSALKSRFRVILVVNIDLRVETACIKGKSCNRSKVSFLAQNCKICRWDTELSKTNQMELLFITFANRA